MYGRIQLFQEILIGHIRFIRHQGAGHHHEACIPIMSIPNLEPSQHGSQVSPIRCRPTAEVQAKGGDSNIESGAYIPKRTSSDVNPEVDALPIGK